MFRNYLTIALRNLAKRRLYSAITIIGLAIGITFSLLIGSYIRTEWQVNTTLKNSDRQYIVQSRWKEKDMGLDITTLGPLGKALQEQYPSLVSNYYRFYGMSSAVSANNRHFRENIAIGDSTLLTLYGFPLLHGNAPTALRSPSSVVITKSKAIKYFGKTDVVGQILTLTSNKGEKQDFVVTAVLKALPNNSVTNLINMDNQIFVSMESAQLLAGVDINEWYNPYIVTYVELADGIKPADLKKPLAQLVSTYTPELLTFDYQAYLTPLPTYYRDANNGLVRKMILTLSSVAVFIILMAIVNFVNISIGSSSSRLKEIGVRKVLGGFKRQLIWQFLMESIVLAVIATLLSLVLFEIARPVFTAISGQEVASLFPLSLYTILALVLLTGITGTLAGIYPAFVLSSLPTIVSLKGKVKSVKENIVFRRVLIASQFSVALIVFFGAVVVSRQVNYFFTKELGYDKEAMFSVALPRDFTVEGIQKMETVRNELQRLPEVQHASFSYEIPNGNFGGNESIYRAGTDSVQSIVAKTLQTDEAFAKTYKIEMAAGQFFHADQGVFQEDHIVLNEAAVLSLGFKSAQEAIGQKIKIYYWPVTLIISGVTKNFHLESMHAAVSPLVFLQVRNTLRYRYLSVRLKPANLSQSVTKVEQAFHQLLPEAPFEFTFMDETLEKLYQSEIQLQQAAQLATGLALVIVLLGVVGMVSLSIARRTKEVGIRKVLGASVWAIIQLFLKEFLLVMGLAVGIAFPLAFMLMSRWLQSYAYQIDIGWMPFVGLGLAFALFVTVIISMQTFSVARANPVHSLRDE